MHLRSSGLLGLRLALVGSGRLQSIFGSIPADFGSSLAHFGSISAHFDSIPTHFDSIPAHFGSIWQPILALYEHTLGEVGNALTGCHQGKTQRAL